MAKLDASLFSFNARGSIADTLTFQKGKSGQIVRHKPRLPYFLTLPTQYQRWLYQDYAYLWTLQSEATQQVYRSLGSRCALTGFQYWMSYQLTNLPDIMGMWYLDANRGATTPDASRFGNTATVFGASPADGFIDGCFFFDGLNDWLDCGADPSLTVLSDWSVEMLVRLDSYAPLGFDFRTMIGSLFAPDYWSLMVQSNTNNLYLRVYESAVLTDCRALINFTLATKHHIVAQKAQHSLELWYDGVLVKSQPHTIGTLSTLKLLIGHKIVKQYWHGLIDHTIFRNRILDQTEIERHSLREYSLQ